MVQQRSVNPEKDMTSYGVDSVVGGIGFEPMASSVSTKRSPPDLTAHEATHDKLYTIPARL